ncbi:MAG TPA: ABC transporter permease [Gemmatimonadaceae bacterium]|jgi:predicted permease
MSLRDDIVYSWRSLRRAPLFSASVILTLTIGIGSAAAISAVVNAVLIRPLPYGHPDQLVGVWFDMPAMSLTHAQQTAGTYRTFKQFAHSVDGIGLYQDGSLNVADPDGRGEPERLSSAWTTASTIPLLQVTPILGRTFSEAEDAPKGPLVVVISEGLWRSRYGGNKDVIGKRLTISGKPVEIIGVMPASFRFPNAETKLWLPLQLDPNDPYPGGFSYDAVARLKPGISIDAAQRDFTNVLPRVLDVAPNLTPTVPMKMVIDQAKPTPHLVAMRDDVVGDVSRTLWMVAATALLMLLVTCANVANLLLVRADARHRELSVRAALGAGSARVLAHFFAESALLTAISAALGIGVAAVGIHALVNAGPSEIPRLAEVHVDGAIIAFTIIVAVLIALACSAIPAIRFLRSEPLAGLRDGGRGGTIGAHRQRARSALVAAQVAFALVVLAASGLLLRSFQHLRAVRPGFNADHVATLWVATPSPRYANDTSVAQFYARVVNEAAQLPGVTAAGITSHLPFNSNGMDSDPFFVEGYESANKKIPSLEIYVWADGGYFKAMGIPLLAGRTFNRLEQQRGDEAIISAETAREFFHDSTGRAAVGKRFQELPGTTWYTVIGVVGSVRDTSLSAAPTRTVYLSESLGGDTNIGGMRRTMALVVHTRGDEAEATRAMQRMIRNIDPTLPTFGVRSMRAAVDASMTRLTFTMIILAVAAIVTLILSVIGLYGVIAYVVTLRTRELGVRIALGAQPRAVAAMVTRQGMTLCAFGMVAGLVLVAVTGRFLRALLFEVAPSDPVVLGGTVGVLLLAALVASWIPARRAARVDPIEALRAD